MDKIYQLILHRRNTKLDMLLGLSYDFFINWGISYFSDNPWDSPWYPGQFYPSRPLGVPAVRVIEAVHPPVSFLASARIQPYLRQISFAMSKPRP